MDKKKSYRRSRYQFKKSSNNARPVYQKKTYENHNQFTGIEVGITEFVSAHKGFTGVIKARFSDFQVNEIDLQGNVAKLTHMTMPKEFKEEVVELEDLKDVPNPSPHIPEETWSKIVEIVKNDSDESVQVEVTKLNKEERKEIYFQVRKALGTNVLATSTFEGDGADAIKFIKFAKQKGQDLDNRIRWPNNLGEYMHFLLYKEGMDTMVACLRLGSFVKIKPSEFNYAGVKDRRSKSTQWMSVRRLHPKKLFERTALLRNVHVGNVTFKDEPLKLGQLKGNQFRIALRNVKVQETELNPIMESLKTNGFINYYGLQRFGNNKEAPTFEIGVKLLQGQWKTAVDLILKPKQYEDPMNDLSKAKKIYLETRDAAKALAEITQKNSHCIEGKLLIGLANGSNNDYVNALENVPRNMRLLYLHSFQSLIWNKVVSKRIKDFGLKPIVGDLVLVEDGEENCVETNTEDVIDNDTEEVIEESIGRKVKTLTEQDLPNYTIFDVVLPLPGFDIQYPENEIKNLYKTYLEEHGLSLEMYKQKVKTYNLSGAYRKIMEKAINLSWKIVKYNDPNDNLIQSDYEELIGTEQPINDPKGQYSAVIMEFCLNSCSYATMVLREVLRMETSSSSHAKLNDYHKINTVPTTSEKTETINEETMLNDKEKFQKFKDLIFNTNNDDSDKRKIENEPDQAGKKARIE